MRLSLYNTYLTISEKYQVVYNSFTDKFLIIKGRSSSIRDLSVERLKTADNDTYEKMIQIGAIVETEKDEIEELTAAARRRMSDKTVWHLHINPTLDCNFNCWYCYENHVKGSRMSPETISAVHRLISSIVYQESKPAELLLAFFGGEPLLCFDTVVKPLIDGCKHLCESTGISPAFHFTTNGYLLSGTMIDYFKDKTVSFQITLDGDKKNHDQTRFPRNGGSSYDTIVRNVFRLAENGHSIVLRINYTASNAGSLKGIYDSLTKLSDSERERISVDLQRVWQDIPVNEDSLTDGIINDLRGQLSKSGFAVSHGLMDYVRYPCYGDMLTHTLINYNGDIFNCTARDFSSKNRAGFLTTEGEIIYENNSPEQRMSLKLSKNVCRTCRIAPLCGGGCTQRCLERAGENTCNMNYTEAQKDKVVLDRLETVLSNRMS